ncbi:MAG: hypothetical protein HFE82_02855 [Erysipelotrichaceae bacterium]|nr:hypothetical protein [Erysipelotrichaceae bacterium]
MVEVKRICAAEKSFIGIHLHLPGYPSYMIVTAKTILAQNMFQIQYFEKDADIAVIITEYHYGFDALLNARVIAMNEAAKAHGVTLMMNGKEALLLCESER